MTFEFPPLVGIGNLRVVLLQEDGLWFAQALEIDYLVEGVSVSDVKKKFEKGLKATINLNLQVSGGIEKMLKAAPPEVWTECLYYPSAKLKKVDSISVHTILTEPEDKNVFPFNSVDFYVPAGVDAEVKAKLV